MGSATIVYLYIFKYLYASVFSIQYMVDVLTNVRSLNSWHEYIINGG